MTVGMSTGHYDNTDIYPAEWRGTDTSVGGSESVRSLTLRGRKPRVEFFQHGTQAFEA